MPEQARVLIHLTENRYTILGPSLYKNEFSLYQVWVSNKTGFGPDL